MALRLLRGEHTLKQLQQPDEGQRRVRQDRINYVKHASANYANTQPNNNAEPEYNYDKAHSTKYADPDSSNCVKYPYCEA
ncbi:hypothetical protein MRX96_020376 [Rhipicephalus microplus]